MMSFDPAFYMSHGSFPGGVEALTAFLFPAAIFFLYGVLLRMLLSKKHGPIVALILITVAMATVAIRMAGSPTTTLSFSFDHNLLFVATMLIFSGLGGLLEDHLQAVRYVRR